MTGEHMSNKWEFKAEDIFQDIDDDAENVSMTIPQEILDEKGWGPGTELKISWSEGQIILEEATKEVDGEGQRFIRIRGGNSKSSP